MKRISLLIMSFLLISSMGLTVFAKETLNNPFSENKIREQQIIDAILNGNDLPSRALPPTISPRWTCINGCPFLVPSVCSADGRVESVGTHSYGWLGGEACTFTVLCSRGGYVCSVCQRVDLIDGEHWCWEVHRDCGKGQIDMCPMDVS